MHYGMTLGSGRGLLARNSRSRPPLGHESDVQLGAHATRLSTATPSQAASETADREHAIGKDDGGC